MRLFFLCFDVTIFACCLLLQKSNATGFRLSPAGAFQTVPTVNTKCQTMPIFLASDGNDDILPSEGEDDTTRVRIWRVLASGEEHSLKQLGAAVGERGLGDLKVHLQHVEKQAKTLKNKNEKWRERRGLPTTNVKAVNKLRIKLRRGNKNEVFIRLGWRGALMSMKLLILMNTILCSKLFKLLLFKSDQMDNEGKKRPTSYFSKETSMDIDRWSWTVNLHDTGHSIMHKTRTDSKRKLHWWKKMRNLSTVQTASFLLLKEQVYSTNRLLV